MNTFHDKNTRPASVIYASRSNVLPSRCKGLQDVRLKPVTEDMVLGRTLMPASAAKKQGRRCNLSRIAAPVSLPEGPTGLLYCHDQPGIKNV